MEKMDISLMGTYLFYDENVPECHETADYLTQQDIAFTKVRCSGMWEAKLAVGLHTFHGIERIKSGIERLLEERKENES